jgi:predicted dehydrogenase
MPEPLPLLLVGCGTIARAYADALQQGPAMRAVAVVDPDPAARAAMAARLQAREFADLDAALAAGMRAAAALVLAPPDRHEALCTQLLSAGLHVLCEKPLAPTVAAAERMLAAARAAERRLMLASKFRYTADVVAARKLLDEGVCGDVVLYENVFCSHVDMTNRWNGLRERSGGGVLIDNGCHSVDVARSLLGPIRRVHAAFGKQVQPLEVEDTARMSFTSAGNAIGAVDLSWSLHKETASYVRLHGSLGTIEIGWRQSRWKARDGQWQPFGSGYDKVAAFAAQLADFAASVHGARPAIDAADALASVVVIDCAYRAASLGTWVDVPETGLP